MKNAEKRALRSQLANGKAMSVASLLAKTGGNDKGLMKFFDWMHKQHDFPYLIQGDDDPDLDKVYQGQSIVWDGTFSLDTNGELIYKGWAECSGFGGKVQRVVKVTDLVTAG